jgi:hypothetical protein
MTRGDINNKGSWETAAPNPKSNANSTSTSIKKRGGTLLLQVCSVKRLLCLLTRTVTDFYSPHSLWVADEVHSCGTSTPVAVCVWRH